MKKSKQASFAFVAAVALVMYSCKPNGDKNSMDTENSHGEGAVDSTKIPKFDSAHADSSHASLSEKKILNNSIWFNAANVNRIEKKENVFQVDGTYQRS